MPGMTLYFRQETLKLVRTSLLPYIGLVDDTGTEISGGDPAYARKAASWTDPDENGIMYPSDDHVFDIPGGGTKVAGWRAFTALTGGENCGGKDFATPLQYNAQGTFLLEKENTGLKAI